MQRRIADMNLTELYQYQAWLYNRIDYLRHQKRIAKYDSKWFRIAGISVLYIEDELKKLEKIRKDVSKHIELKQKRGGY